MSLYENSLPPWGGSLNSELLLKPSNFGLLYKQFNTGLARYYPLHTDGSEKKSGANGTLVGSSGSWGTGPVAGCFTTGPATRIIAPNYDFTNSNNSWTYNFWVNPTAQNFAAGVFGTDFVDGSGNMISSIYGSPFPFSGSTAGAWWHVYDNAVRNGVIVGGTAAYPVSYSTWHMITVTNTATGSGNLLTNWYVDGVRWVTNYPYAPMVSNTSSNLFIGNFASLFTGYHPSAAWWSGSVAELGIWDRTLTDSEVNVLYNKGMGITWSNTPQIDLSTKHHPLDADTLALWRLDGLETITTTSQQRDISGNGYHLTLNSSTENSPVGLVPDLGNSSTKDTIYRCPTDSTLVTALKDTPGWSVELWFNNVDSVAGSDNMIFCIGTATANHYTVEEEDLFLIKVNPAGKTTVAVMVPGSSNNSWNEYAFDTFPTTPGVHHLAITWLPTNSTDATVTAYLDGALHGTPQTAARLTAANAGTNTIIQLRGYPVNNYRPMIITIDDIRLSKVARTATEVLASYNAGQV